MTATPFEDIVKAAEEAVGSLRSLADKFEAAAELFTGTLLNGGTVLTAGNGGSAAEAMHMAEELSGRYKGERRPLPGISLCSDGTAMTCICNDYGAGAVFSRQVEAIGRKGDLLVVFSTSGNSGNIIDAVAAAKKKDIRVIALLGRGGGAMRGAADVEIIVNAADSAHIQEAHQVVMHALLERIEEALAQETCVP